MKKLALFLLLLLFSRGLASYAAATSATTNSFENLIFGANTPGVSNVNQVLAVVIGPQGIPGPAGVAGKNGFVGLNGLAGKDGIPGAPGPIGPGGPIGPAGPAGANGANGPAGANGANGANGPAGANGANGPAGANGANGPAGANGREALPIAIIQLAPGDPTCPQGGSKFIAPNGDQTFACSGTGSIIHGRGSSDIVSCDDAIDLGMLSHFDTLSHHFLLDGIRVSGLSSTCATHRLEVTLSTTAIDGTNQPFLCSVASLPDAAGGDLYLARPGYNLKSGEVGLVVPLTCDPDLSTMDLTILDSIMGFQFS